jgi:hypothetical protein
MESVRVEKEHIGNIKLSASKKAIKLHLFNPEHFYVIPLQDLSQKVGKVFEYIEGIPEVIGEISQPEKGKKQLWKVIIKNNRFIYIKDSYIQMMKNESELSLPIHEE